MVLSQNISTVFLSVLAGSLMWGGQAILREQVAITHARQLVKEKDLSPAQIEEAHASIKVSALGWGFSSQAARISRQLDARRAVPSDASRAESQVCEEVSRREQEALRLPFDSASHLGWYRASEQSQNAACYNPGDGGKILQFARERYPIDDGILFASAIEALDKGIRSEGFLFGREFLKVAPRVTRDMEDALLSHVKMGNDLELLIPISVRAVIHWSKVIRSRRPDLHPVVLDVLEHRQRTAIQTIAEMSNSNSFAAGYQQDLLFQLERVAQSDDIRRSCDSLLAKLLVAQDSLFSKYLADRSRLELREIVRAVRHQDLHPERSSFVQWSPISNVTLDDGYTSLGLFIPEKSPGSLVELRAEGGSVDIASVLKVYSSRDNARWTERTSEVVIESFGGSTRQYIGIKFPHQEWGYWKIHYARHDQQRKFFNEMSEIVQVFGE